MNVLHNLFNLILHLDIYLVSTATFLGKWLYFILFTIFFCETGIVFAVFLPGDSLLFAVGAFTAHPASTLNIHLLFFLLFSASVLGNALNYYTGRWIGSRIFRYDSFLFNKNHIQRAHIFYEKYGGKAIILARFLPIVRALIPFIAGIGKMRYISFLIFNGIGAALWIGGLLYGSYLFGNIPLVHTHFSFVILGILTLSLLPLGIQFARQVIK